MSDLDLDALDEMYHRGAQPTLDEGKALVAEVQRLERVLGVVTGIKDRLLEERFAEHPEVPHP